MRPPPPRRAHATARPWRHPARPPSRACARAARCPRPRLPSFPTLQRRRTWAPPRSLLRDHTRQGAPGCAHRRFAETAQGCAGVHRSGGPHLVYDARVAKADDLDWNDLRYFLAAARAKTLAGAARSLGVEHSTIGRRLTALEEALGAPLVTRGSDGL